MKFLGIIIYALLLIGFLYFIYKRLKDINGRNADNIGCVYLKKRNDVIFFIILLLLIILFFLGSLYILTLI